MFRFQIFFSPSQTDAQRALPPAGRFGRVKAVVAALLLASAFIGFLIAALVLGSILAAVLIILVAVAFTVALFKPVIHRPRR
jgi:hypothetical protein